MPPYIDETIEQPKLFYSDGDGNYVPFPGIQSIVLPKIDDPEYTDTVRIWNPADELSFSMTLTHRSSRIWKKQFHAFKTRLMRSVRTMKRQKEKQRRNRLKGKV